VTKAEKNNYKTNTKTKQAASCITFTNLLLMYNFCIALLFCKSVIGNNDEDTL